MIGAAVPRTRGAYFAVTLLIAGIVAWGFWKTYYSQFSERTDLPAIVHWHAAVFSAWVLVLSAQAAAVAAGRVRLHRRLGTAGMIYGALVFSVGLVVSVGAPALRVRAGDYPLEVGGVIVLYNLTDMLLFGAFLALAFAYRTGPSCTSAGSLPRRRRCAARLSAAWCRATRSSTCCCGCRRYSRSLSIDLATRRRVHPVPLAAAALIVVAFFKVPLLSAPVWRDVGGALLRPFV